MDEKITEIRPYKWSSWGIEIYSRENRNGRIEYAYIVEEQKWSWIRMKGNYSLEPVEQDVLIAPLFEFPEDSTDLYFVVDGECDSNEADGGGEEVELLEQHLKTEYATLEKQDKNLGERDRLYQMGFTDNDFRIVVQFKQRKLGE